MSTPPNLTIGGVGAVSDPIFINNDVRAASGLPPGVFVSLSPGASLHYIVEATGDPNDANGSPSPGNWSEVLDFRNTPVGYADNTISKASKLPFMARAIRIRMDNWTSGTATLSVVQA